MHLASRLLLATLLLMCSSGMIHNTSHMTLHSGSAVDPQWPHFVPSDSLSGVSLRLVANLATLHLAEDLAEALRHRQPALRVRAQSVDVAQTPSWWQLSTEQAVALLSEPMSEREMSAFQEQWGYPPTRLRLALNPVVIVVHPSNPVASRGLSLAELDAIFGTTPVRGHDEVQRWGDLGMDGVWAQAAITAHSHDASASLFVYFRQHVLVDGTFKNTVIRQPSSQAVVQAVGRDPYAIGYVGLNFVNPVVRLVPLRIGAEHLAVTPTREQRFDRRYPLPHAVYLYLNWPPGSTLDASLRELLRFLYSRQGQQHMAERGYLPLPAQVAAHALRQIGLSRDGRTP